MIIEKHIGKSAIRGHIVLLHAKRFFPEVSTHMLYPFCVSEAMYLKKLLNLDASGRVPLQKLTSTDAPISRQDQHNWIFLVGVLESKVQMSSKGLPKWKLRARL